MTLSRLPLPRAEMFLLLAVRGIDAGLERGRDRRRAVALHDGEHWRNLADEYIGPLQTVQCIKVSRKTLPKIERVC